jgi:putative thioredoxin
MLASGASAPPDSLQVKDTTTRDFMVDVIEESRTQPVLVDFWAPWCGPCKQLAPVLEKTVAASNGAVKLVKMNIDEHPAIAGQLGIQSIPAVIAFVNGQPIDGVMGAVPESQIKTLIDRLGAGAGGTAPDPSELLDAGEAALAGNALTEATEIFAAVLQQNPEEPRALAGLARVRLAGGDTEGARAVLDSAPPKLQNDTAIAGARAQIELAERGADLGEIPGLEARLAADPADHQARFDLALALAAAGRNADALDHLLDIVRRDRTWNDDAARKQLVQFFDAWGPTDAVTVAGRRRLSSLLFA